MDLRYDNVDIQVCLSVYTACKDTILRSAPSNANATYNLLTFLAAYTNTVISTICLLITVFLRRYNFRRYKNRFLKEKLGKLTERYQVYGRAISQGILFNAINSVGKMKNKRP